jgi:hypothetical protein
LYFQNNNENGGKFSNFVVRMSLASVKYVKYAYLVPDVVAYEFYTSVLVSGVGTGGGGGGGGGGSALFPIAKCPFFAQRALLKT